MLYSKNGSIPQPETDGLDGWIEVPDKPECPENKEIIWWYPPGWVIRDPKPNGDWIWNQTNERWINLENLNNTNQINSIETLQISNLNG
jgi:hypothetical protein